MATENTLYLQLHKLSGAKSFEALDHLVSILWQTRKTGLRSLQDKTHLQSLLNLSLLSDLDAVLACLRSLIRKWAYDDLTDDHLLKLFPPDLPVDIKSNLLLLFHKYQSQWKTDISNEPQRYLRRVSFSTQMVKMSAPPCSNILAALWPRQDDPNSRFTQNGCGASLPYISDVNHCDVAPTENLEILPRLKSMTWTMDNRSSGQSNRIAIITLKLQDYTKSPSGEPEIKFQLTRDTLEAMLISLSYISEQLSGMAGKSLEPVQKKHKQLGHTA